MASTNTGQEGLVLSFLFDTDEWVLENTAGFRNVGSTIDRVKLISAVSGPERPHQLILNWQSTGVLNTANVRAGDSVVVFGAGGVGLNAVSGARLAGASRIVVIDIQQQRLDAARRFGATDVIDSTKSKAVEALRELLPGGADHVFDFVGLKLVAEEGLAMLGVGGGLYLVGVSKPDVDISLNIFGAIGGQQRVVGVNFGSTNAKRDIPMYAQLYLQGRMNLDDLVSKEISLREVNDGYAALTDGSLNRVVVTSF
jgi:S-(hydroxymethyl)glutathione dehydrogenase/alcohol dehydrogenase